MEILSFYFLQNSTFKYTLKCLSFVLGREVRIGRGTISSKNLIQHSHKKFVEFYKFIIIILKVILIIIFYLFTIKNYLHEQTHDYSRPNYGI